MLDMTRLMCLREWLWVGGGGGGEEGLITRKRKKNTLLYLSPREVHLSGLHQRKLATAPRELCSFSRPVMKYK
jgi:hypothetical protein